MPGGFGDPTADVAEMTAAIAASGDSGMDPNAIPAGTPPPGIDPEFAPPVAEEPEPELPAEPDVEAEVEPEAEEEPLAPEGAADTITLPDGTVMSLARMRELATIDQQFKANPRLVQEVERAAREQGLLPGATAYPGVPPVGGVGSTPPGAVPAPSQPAPPAAPSLPEDIDPYDPTARWVQQQMAALAQQQAELVVQQQAIAQHLQSQQTATSTRALEQVRSDFASRYPHLTFDDIAAVEAKAGADGLGIFYMQRYGDPYRAGLDAMETAAGSMPDIRPKLLAAPPADVTNIDKAKHAKKQQNLNAIAGKGGTAPRTEPAQARKMTAEEKVDAIAAEIARAAQAQ